jgi:hypothetical protein
MEKQAMIELNEIGKRLQQAGANLDARTEAWISDETKAGRSNAVCRAAPPADRAAKTEAWLADEMRAGRSRALRFAAQEEYDRAKSQRDEAAACGLGYETVDEMTADMRRAKIRVEERKRPPRGWNTQPRLS